MRSPSTDGLSADPASACSAPCAHGGTGHLRLDLEPQVDQWAVLAALDLTNLAEVTARVFASPQRFSVRESLQAPGDPTLVSVDERRRDALLRAVSAAAGHWSDTERRVTPGLLDVLWNVPSYERLVGLWGVDGADVVAASLVKSDPRPSPRGPPAPSAG